MVRISKVIGLSCMLLTAAAVAATAAQLSRKELLGKKMTDDCPAGG